MLWLSWPVRAKIYFTYCPVIRVYVFLLLPSLRAFKKLYTLEAFV